MNVFIQGMRRSGTTILFDALYTDSQFDHYYEPLAAAKAALGGGSGVRAVDYFEKVRRARKQFLDQFQEPLTEALLNLGAPRLPELEFQPGLPGYARSYIQYLTRRSEHTVLKFTRMYSKVEELARIDPDARFLHIVRDPRAVTASYLFGKGKINRNMYPNPEAFFSTYSDYGAWSSFPFSQYLLGLPAFAHLAPLRDFERIMLIWKYTFQSTYRAGREHFGDNYCLIRLEDLRLDPRAVLSRLYGVFGRPIPMGVLEWANHHVSRDETLVDPENPNWTGAIDRLALEPELDASGYGYLIN